MSATTTDYIGEDLIPLEEDAPGPIEIAPLNEDFEERVHAAQEQLLKLRHQQDALEKHKEELELLNSQQEKFIHGREELSERLTRGISMLEREAFEAEKRVEHYLHSKDAFARHLEIIEAFNPETWVRTELRSELTHALSAIDDAESDYRNCMSRTSGFLERQHSEPSGNALAPAAPHVDTAHRFQHWFLNGLAFTLPLMIFAFLGMGIYLFFAA